MPKLPTLSQIVGQHASERPQAVAFYCAHQQLCWHDYDQLASRLAAVLLDWRAARGDVVAVLLPDGIDLHVTLLALEKAGLVALGIGPRAGRREIQHLLRVSAAKALISLNTHIDIPTSDLVSDLSLQGIALAGHFTIDDSIAGGHVRNSGVKVDLPPLDEALRQTIEKERMSVSELFLLNSTSGTTGMPKCVAHNQNRWIHYHNYVMASAPLGQSDVFLSAIPGTFGFGLWTSRFTPTLLGCPTVILPKFGAAALIQAIEAHNVTVMAAVSTQFIMMLNSPHLQQHKVDSLRILYTGGEAVPYTQAAEFERKTGACVLQFYGSNETGALSYTSITDSREKRLTTAGKLIADANVRLLNEAGDDVTGGGRGQPACKGSANSLGYYNNEAAQKKLYTADGWMLTGDIAELDAEGYLKIVGRSADFIIRGGKNISGPAVEQAVTTHPSVNMAAAVAMPDPVFGEKVCVYVCIKPGQALTLDALCEHLLHAGYSREYFPERLIISAELPYASGGKVAKHLLREDIIKRMAEDSLHDSSGRSKPP